MNAERYPDVVVLLPGITGSVLQKDGRDVWAPSGKALLRGLLSLGKSLRALEVEDDDWRRDDLGDGITAPRLASDVHLVPGLWKIDGYTAIEDFLVSSLGLTRGENYHAFPYDWRRDNRASARRLQQQANGWLRRWREGSGKRDAQLVLVGHSMGGLVARYFVEALGGWEVTRAVVTFGTPFYGSLNAVDFLVNGIRKGIGPLKVDLTPAMRSMSSVHQLVPSYRCVYGASGAVLPSQAGLPGWKDSWTQHLTSFQDEMEEGAAAARQDPAFEQNPVVYRPVVGTDQRTNQSALLRDGTVTLAARRGDADEGGDGTVPFLSAALSGTEDMRTFAPERHARLQNYSAMLDHVRGVVRALRRPAVGDLRSGVEQWFTLTIEDLLMPGEPLVAEVSAHSWADEHDEPVVDAELRVSDRSTGETVQRRALAVPRAPLQVELGPLAPGQYLVEVLPAGNGASVSDVVVSAAEEELVE